MYSLAHAPARTMRAVCRAYAIVKEQGGRWFAPAIVRVSSRAHYLIAPALGVNIFLAHFGKNLSARIGHCPVLGYAPQRLQDARTRRPVWSGGKPHGEPFAPFALRNGNESGSSLFISAPTKPGSIQHHALACYQTRLTPSYLPVITSPRPNSLS